MKGNEIGGEQTAQGNKRPEEMEKDESRRGVTGWLGQRKYQAEEGIIDLKEVLRHWKM